MNRLSVYKVGKMDCPCEENLIRLKLQSIDGILNQEYNLEKRTLTIVHSCDVELIEQEITQLNLDSSLIKSEEFLGKIINHDDNQRRVLIIVLIINFAFFLLEMITGLISKSMGLVADSLDMLADSFVYGLSLLAIGTVISKKKRVATISGYFQIILAIIGFVEVLKRFIGFDQVPDFRFMIIISFFALSANIASLLILSKSKSNDAHIKASIIFSSNDIIINLGVIIAGVLVWILNNNIPDLIIGSLVFIVVIRGAFRILKLGK